MKSLTKVGTSGTLGLYGDNSYTGGTVLEGGTILLGHDQPSVFAFTGLASVAFTNNIAGTAAYGYGGGISSSSVELGAGAHLAGNRAGGNNKGGQGGAIRVYTFGLYSKVRVVDNLYANAFLGYGSQRYESSRTDIAGLHRAKYDGDSMYASLEFFRPLNWRRNMTLFPLFALDYQRSWTDGFTESGDYGQKVKRADMDRFVMRVGLNSKICWNDRLNVSTRLQYGYLLGGDVHGVARTQFAAASPTSPVLDVGTIYDKTRSQCRTRRERLYYWTRLPCSMELVP